MPAKSDLSLNAQLQQILVGKTITQVVLDQREERIDLYTSNDEKLSIESIGGLNLTLGAWQETKLL